MKKFAFIVHPMEAADIGHWFAPAGLLPGPVLKMLLRLAPSFRASPVTGIESPCGRSAGWLVALPLTAGQITGLPARSVASKLVRSGRLARRLGAGVVGLGGMLPLAGEAVSALKAGLDLPVTCGRAYTIAAGLEALRQAALLMGNHLKNTRALVVGAGDPPGRLLSLLLAREVKRMTLAGGHRVRLEELAGKIYYDSGLSVTISPDLKEALKVSQLVIVAGRGEGYGLEAVDPAPGSVVLWLAPPSGSAPGAGKPRDDVLFIREGLLALPGGSNTIIEPESPPGLVCPALAETIILALEGCGRALPPDGPVTVRQVEEMACLGRKHGFKLAGFKTLNGCFTPAGGSGIIAGAQRAGNGAIIPVNG